VGHETDFTISDFVADLRAPTPSAAAEIISQNHSNLLESFSRNKTQIENRFLNLMSQLKEELDLKIALLRHPGEKLRETSQKIDNFETRMKGTLINISLEKKNTLEANIALLKRSSPITRIKSSQNRIKVGSMKLINSISKNIETKKKTYLQNINTLEAVSPLSVLGRGYSIVTDESSNIITSSLKLKANDKIKARFKEGEVLAKVIEIIDEE
jgi:exodeoxyribonuclease VII large subunit